MTLPSRKRMYRALIERDTHFEGVFFVGVKTTGIFCRPSCRARKPKPENVEFFARAKQAMLHGYRPCKVCKPFQTSLDIPDWMELIFSSLEKKEEKVMKDAQIRDLGVDPIRVRRWFQKHHDMTFQAYLRSLRIGMSLDLVKQGEKVVDAAFGSGYQSLSGFGQAAKKQSGQFPFKASQQTSIYIDRISTPLGPMMIGTTEQGLCLLEFCDRKMLESELKDLQKRLKANIFQGKNTLSSLVSKQLNEYFQGKRKIFDIPLHTPGSAFSVKVWNGLKEIPYGKTRSYQEQAVMLKDPKAIRAVARANGMNRIAIIIPCHRVIGKNGKLVGYGGGLWRKQRLLDLEIKGEVLMSSL
ncbi:MAG: methylated-DNA--[protein]-cysteine S-methyltransferase [Bdellovibrionota bacterium]